MIQSECRECSCLQLAPDVTLDWQSGSSHEKPQLPYLLPEVLDGEHMTTERVDFQIRPLIVFSLNTALKFFYC